LEFDAGIVDLGFEKELAAVGKHGRVTIPKQFHEKLEIKTPGELPRAANRRIDHERSTVLDLGFCSSRTPSTIRHRFQSIGRVRTELY